MPYRYKDNPQLATWVRRKREMFNKEKLTNNRFYQIDELGFEWDPFNKVWADNRRSA